MSKTVVVTGGSCGIGATVCRSLACEGYAVAIVYNSSKDEAEKLADELSGISDVKSFKADVSKSVEVKSAVSEIIAHFGKIDALVNCAGIAEQALFTDITDDMWQKMLGVNLTGQFNFCRAVVPDMIRRKNGKIVNIASMWGEVGASMEVHYSASKAGVIGLTKALAKEVAPSGITVNAVSPGVIMTDMMASFDSQTLEELRCETPLEKLGRSEDVANAVSFLLSDKADFVTGTVLSVNGGFVI